MKVKIVYVIMALVILLGLKIFYEYKARISGEEEYVYDDIQTLIEIDTGIVAILIPQKTYYRIGESPQLDVVLINRTGKRIYLPGCLDGSSDKIRLPYCDFVILNPGLEFNRFIDVNPNPLLKEDLVLLNPNESFDPLKNYQLRMDTFPADTLLGLDTHVSTRLNKFWTPRGLYGNNFLIPGNYDIQFVYSTEDSIETFLGWNCSDVSCRFVASYIDSIPRFTAKSNVVRLKYRLF